VRPRWRWHLFCLGLWLHWYAPGPIARIGLRLVGWAPLPEWFGEGAELGEETPF
jgi:hypothetical protein